MKNFACCIIASLFIAFSVAPLHANLFNKPEVNFWYPPYAPQQPQWKDGKLVIDLKQAAGKDLAVLNIVPEGVQQGKSYTFSFMAEADSEAPLIVNVPQAEAPGAKKTKSDWALHNAEAQRREIVFTYQPDLVEQKSITFFWDKSAIDKKTLWTFSDFTLLPFDGTAPVETKTNQAGGGPMTGMLSGKGGPFVTKFWYPPYASAQPQVDGGKITVDLKQAAGKDLAVLELALPAGMTESADYIFSFKAAAQPDGALVVLVPDPHPNGEKENEKFKPRSDWAMHGAGATQRLIEFVYRPNLVSSGDKITLFWDKSQIDQKTVWTLSDFSLEKAN